LAGEARVALIVRTKRTEVSVLFRLTVILAGVAVRPDEGEIVTTTFTLPVKPFSPVTVTLDFTTPVPASTCEKDVGLAVTVKSGVAVTANGSHVLVEPR
jgi:hypothetical protein